MNNPNDGWPEDKPRSPFSALQEQIRELSRENPQVHAALAMWQMGRCTQLEAMQLCVIQLAAANKSYEKTLVEFANRQPAPVVMRPGL